MTATPPGAIPASEDRREEVLRTALRQARWSLGLSVVLLVAIVGGTGYAVVAVERGLPVEEAQLLEAARETLAAHADDIAAEVRDLTAEVVPPLADAFFREIEADLPAYMRAVDDQGEILTRDLETWLRGKLKARFREFLTRNRRVLQEEFPEITDRQVLDRMLNDFERAFDQLLDRYYVDDFRSTAQRIRQTWRQFPPAPPPRPGQPSLGEQLVADLATWLQREWTGPGQSEKEANP